MKITIPKPILSLKSHLSLIYSLCFFLLLPAMVLAQNGVTKPVSLEAQKKKPKSITVNGQEIPIAGHNNISKLIRMSQKNGDGQKPFPGLEDIQSRETYEWLMLRDPRTNQIPADIRKSERQFAQELLFEQGIQRPKSNVGESSAWKRRGPYNVGGRTRALAIDRTDTTRILAGGVSGGMWLSEDGGKSWRKTTGSSDLQAVSCVVQDPTDDSGLTWYYGTGEIRGNSAAGNGAPFRGDGLFKSTDGGLSWAQMPSTLSNTPHVFDPGFDYVHNLAIDPTNGDIWAAAFANVLRSQDNGVSWDTVFYNGTTWTDIAISSQGDVFATLGIGSGDDWGVYHRPAGATDFLDVTPDEFKTGNLSRTVMSIAPSDENTVFFLAENAGGTAVLGASLMKYTYDPTADEGNRVTWEDRSANIPAFGGSVGNYNSQGAYNQVIKVHPTNPDIVFIGGTNLYRSTDGFATSTATSWIGGYGTANNVSLYENHHPDQHALVFYPNSTVAVLSGNDGGVQFTANVLEDGDEVTPVDWTSLNNGYYTTQPYALSLDPTAESPDMLIAGFQDNGSWLTNSEEANALWTEEFGGDGSFNAIANGGRSRLVSSQNGNAFVFYYENPDDESGDYTGWTQLRPPAAGFSFINPFILDPNDENVLYVASTSGVWRNSDYTQIPLFTNGSTVNWSLIPGSEEAFGTVTSLEASTVDPNILYFGTSGGEVWRAGSVHSPSPEVSLIGEFLGSVSGIAVDPKDADRLIVTLSNYNVRSIFYTEDAGENWTDISGNLETTEDGIGPGPSVRWAEILHYDDGTYYFAGTSTGLYSTKLIDIDASGVFETVWDLESENLIGNAVIRHMAVRPYDGTIAVATHANGMYSNQIPVTQEDRIFANKLDDVTVIFGTESLSIDISGLFEDEGDDNSPLDLEVFEITNDTIFKIALDLDNELLNLQFNDSIPGVAGITLSASSDDRIAFSSFSVSIEELQLGFKTVYDQVTNPGGAGITSQVFTDLGGPVWSADDFEVPAGDTWDIQQVFAPGGKNASPIDEVVVQFWLPADDEDALPEIIIFSDTVRSDNGPDDGNLLLTLRETLTLTEGYYWMSITPILPFAGNAGRWFWNRTAEGFGNQYHLIDPANLFGAGYTDWVPATTFNADLLHLNFAINGTSDLQAATDPVETPFATAASPSEIELEWSKGESHTAYILYTSEDGVEFTNFVTIPAEDENAYTFDRLTANTQYYYGIEAIDVLGDTTSMAVDNAFTFPEVPEIGQPSDVTATSFKFGWTGVDTENYVVYVAALAADGDDLIVQDTISADLTTYSVSNLNPATEYGYTMVAINESGYYVFSDSVSLFTLPSTPGSASVTSTTNNSVSLKWDLNKEEEGVTAYEVWRGLSATELTKTETLVPDDTDIENMFLTHNDESLDANEEYFYEVVAVANEVSSMPAQMSSLTLPDMPTIGDVTNITTSGFVANWTEVSTESYKVDVATDMEFANLVVDDQQIESGNASAAITGLMSATTYYYRIAAVNATGTLGYTDGVMVTTLPDAPSGFASASITNTSLTLSWGAVAETKVVSGYKIMRGTTANSLSQVGSVTTNSFDDTGLEGNTQYFYQIVAFNASGDSEALTGNVLTLPDTPSATAASNITNTGLQANWGAVSADGYYFDFATDDAFTELIRDNSELTSTELVIENLTPAKTYYYRVSSFNDAGKSGYSNTITTTTTITPPQNLAVSGVTQTAANVSWTAVDGVTEFSVDVSASSDFSTTILSGSVVSSPELELTGLDINTEYFVRVVSVGDEFNSEFSEVLSFMTLPEIPGAPTNINLTSNSNSIELTWDLGANDVVDYVLIERSQNNDQNFTSLERLEGSPTSFTDNTLLDPAGIYYYRLKTGNASGESGFSETVSNFVTGIDDELSAAVKLWPNPTNNNAYLRLNNLFSGEIDIDILNASGQVVETIKTNKVSQSMEIELAMSELAEGLYYIKVSTQRGTAVKRILKQ